MPVSQLSKVISLIVVMFVVAGAATGGVAGSADTGPVDPRAAVSGDDFRNATSNVEVWDRGALPLRVSPDDAATSVGNVNAFVNVEALGTGDVPVDRDRQTVYDAGSTLDVTFESKLGADTTRFGGQNVQLLVARLDEDSPAAERLIDGTSATMASQAAMLYDEEYANANASFRLVSAGVTDTDGEVTVDYDLASDGRGPGIYAFFLVQDYDATTGSWGATDGGFEVTGDELRIESHGRVLGVDTTLVQERGATASPSQSVYTAGDDLTFTVDAERSGGSGATTHALVVYDQSTYESARVVTEVSGDVSGRISPDQVTVRRQIASVNGVSAVDRTRLFDTVTLNNGRVARFGSGLSTVDFVAEQLRSDDPLDETTDVTTTLDGSVTVTQGDDAETLTVGTHANWSTGTYRYVYIASGADASEVTTTTGTVQIEQPTTGSASISGDTATVTMPSGGAIVSTEFAFPAGTNADGEVRVTERSTPPAGAGTVSTAGRSIYADFEVPAAVEDTGATLTVTVRKSALDGTDPASFSVWHHSDGQWNELGTSIASETPTTVSYTVVVDGFSPFAVALATPGSGDGDGDVTLSTETPTPTPTPTPTATPTDTPRPTVTTSAETPTPADTTSETAAPAADRSTAESPSTGVRFPGFGVVATLLVLLGATALIARRRE
ncbi:hypothetical protein [Salinigranum sp. GCM10025319]|uniref:hypothetical protein n=1 Tax=Salinigranum sp. GCM10025319 TaxID=3252687 RepID=UPI00360D5A7A